MIPTDKPRWINNVHFILLLGVITTLIISWFNLSSYLTVLLLLVILVTERPQVKVPQIFTNKFFLAYFAIFLVDIAGLLYADNVRIGWKSVESRATLLAIPFIMFAGSFSNGDGFKRVMTAYCFILFIITIVCYVVAIQNYIATGDPAVFFYHDLVNLLKQNAIIFSIFMLGGLLYLISHDLHAGLFPFKQAGALRNFLIGWFFVFIALLASKLMLFILALVLIRFLTKKFLLARSKKALIIVASLFVITVVLATTTDNPIKRRYDDILRGDISLASQDKFTPDVYFNGVQFRLLVWRFSLEILRDQKAWVAGVSPGDSQDFLNQKYIDANMYIGKGDKKDVGFLYYDSHNQFMQQFLQSGLIGLLAFVVACFLMIKRTVQQGTMEAAFMTGTLLAVCMTESLLELQHGLFLFTFFPFLYAYNPKNQNKTVST